MSASSLNPTPIINIAIKALALPIIPAKEVIGVGIGIRVKHSMGIMIYSIKGMDLSSVRITRLIEKRPPSFTIIAILNAVPRQIKPFPISNKHVVITPIGPKKLCTKGSAKQPILYPGRFRISKAR